MNKLKCYFILVLVFSNTPVQATLTSIVYNDVLDIYWMGDANYAYTSDYVTPEGREVRDTDGKMTWDESVEWADQLVYAGFDDWRLWFVHDSLTACANCTKSEFAELFYNELGGVSGMSILDALDPNDYLKLFENIQSNIYWSGVEFTENNTLAGAFVSLNGVEGYGDKKFTYFAWAVRSGDVTAIPVPTAFWLLGSALVGMIGFRFKRGKV